MGKIKKGHLLEQSAANILLGLPGREQYRGYY
jgi:hypothetical protein